MQSKTLRKNIYIFLIVKVYLNEYCYRNLLIICILISKNFESILQNFDNFNFELNRFELFRKNMFVIVTTNQYFYSIEFCTTILFSKMLNV